jgi:dTDP-4-dehydrorhamnose 3,5-epimerase
VAYRQGSLESLVNESFELRKQPETLTYQESSMIFHPTPIAGVFVIEPQPFRDFRGSFERRFCLQEFSDAQIPMKISQINRSFSVKKGTVRGLHYQVEPMSEMKIVQCFRGRVFDVAVDLRKNSPTFLKWYGEILDGENGWALCIPHGCAHGFQTLLDDSEIIYFTDQAYSPLHERGVNYLDPRINIRWPEEVTNISEKDRNAPEFEGDGL